MENDEAPMLSAKQMAGRQYIKLKSGELVRWESFDEETQVFEIKLPNGEILKVHRRDIDIPTSNEEVLRTLTMNQCLKCKSHNVIAGRIGAQARWGFSCEFDPDREIRFLAMTFSRGVNCNQEALACLDCGLVWSHLSARDLKDFITNCCKKPELDA